MTTLKEHLLIWPALIVLGSLLISILYGVHSVLPKKAIYDCRIAEISPDYTPAMREECRKKLKESLIWH
jgi:hypothetical protein